MRLCVRWGHTYPKKKGHPHPTQFLAHVYCGQTAGWMKTPLGTEVDLSPGHIVLDGVPALRERGTAAPLFLAHVYCGQWLRHCDSLGQFKRLLKTYLFGGWDRGAL